MGGRVLLCDIHVQIAGTPVWNTEPGGNHDWVEVFTETGFWSFTGAAEYTDQVMFQSGTLLTDVLFQLLLRTDIAEDP
jgi:hypothetical protein